MAMTNKHYDIDKRQFRCHLKFEKIVNQFDELIQVVDTASKTPKSKRRRVTSSPKRSRVRSEMEGEKSASNSSNYANSIGIGEGSEKQTEDMNGGVLVKFVTTHLNHLNTHHHLR